MHFLRTFPFSERSDFVELFRERLRDTKVVHLTNVAPTEHLVSFYESMVGSLGRLLKKGEHVDGQVFADNEWLDVRYDPNKADTFRHSNTRQPLHTDGAYVTDFPCQIVFLFCLRQADQGGETVFLDGEEVVRALSERQPHLLRELESCPVHFSKGRMGRKTIPIIRREAGDVLLNWNQCRVSPENPPRAAALVRNFQEFLECEMAERDWLTPVRLAAGEAVFFHDQRVLHGRRAFVGNRCLIKGVLNLPRRLAPC
jgi:alpha-ketoglutarate-dependent taurine dioxygenase